MRCTEVGSIESLNYSEQMGGVRTSFNYVLTYIDGSECDIKQAHKQQWKRKMIAG